MLSVKYIRIRRDRPVEQRLASIWRAACAELGIPCILVYLDAEAAYISVNLRHLPPSLPEQPAPEKLLYTLAGIQLQYAGTGEGFWKHHEQYYTFDRIARPAAQAAATAIYNAFYTSHL